MPDARIEIVAEDGAIEAFAAYPEGVGPWPPVIVLPDSWGLRPVIEDIARGLAAQGYFALAPSLPADPAALLSERMDEVAEAWLDYLEAERMADDVRLGVLGYGVGGAVGLRLAAVHAERIAAAAIFYGGRPDAAEAHHLAGCFSAVLYLGHAARDPAAQATAPLEAALRKAGVDFETETYAGGRGFAAPDRPDYDPELAARHWAKLTDLFERALKYRPRQAGDELHVGVSG